MFGLKIFDNEIRDRLLVVVDDHQGTGRELLEQEVIKADSESLTTKTAVYPRHDFECLIDSLGRRVFVARGTFVNLVSLEKIKELEESIVLKSVFRFENPLSMQNIALWVLVILSIANLIS